MDGDLSPLVGMGNQALMSEGTETGVKKIKKFVLETFDTDITSADVRAALRSLGTDRRPNAANADATPSNQPACPMPGMTRLLGEEKAKWLAPVAVPTGDLPNLKEVAEALRPGLEYAMRFHESGRHMLPGDSIAMASVISVAQAKSDDAFRTYQAASDYPPEYLAAMGTGYRRGARDVITFSAQHYGYGRFTIRHNYVHQDDDRTSHYATTSFSFNNVLSITTRKIPASEYAGWCLTQGAVIQPPEQDVCLLDFIARGPKTYRVSMQWGLDVLSRRNIPCNQDAIATHLGNMTFTEDFVRIRCHFPGYSEHPPRLANSMSVAKRLWTFCNS
ncbi:hypothetical protein DL771_009368 [Monosporascus sp. 5C6A]|nr:hypothetical protein DL771_009368 [Monosporascus sp. 5C6A]